VLVDAGVSEGSSEVERATLRGRVARDNKRRDSKEDVESKISAGYRLTIFLHAARGGRSRLGRVEGNDPWYMRVEGGNIWNIKEISRVLVPFRAYR